MKSCEDIIYVFVTIRKPWKWFNFLHCTKRSHLGIVEKNQGLDLCIPKTGSIIGSIHVLNFFVVFAFHNMSFYFHCGAEFSTCIKIQSNVTLISLIQISRRKKVIGMETDSIMRNVFEFTTRMVCQSPQKM